MRQHKRSMRNWWGWTHVVHLYVILESIWLGLEDAYRYSLLPGMTAAHSDAADKRRVPPLGTTPCGRPKSVEPRLRPHASYQVPAIAASASNGTCCQQEDRHQVEHQVIGAAGTQRSERPRCGQRVFRITLLSVLAWTLFAAGHMSVMQQYAQSSRRGPDPCVCVCTSLQPTLVDMEGRKTGC